jgi:hypothetical protein
MGLDTKLHLPPETRVEDVFDVLVIMLGGEATKRYFRNRDGWSTEVTPEPHFSVFSDIPTMTTVDGEVADSRYHVFYHFEGSYPVPGWRQVTTGFRERRRPLWMAMADFFGGMLDMNDCDDIAVDYIGRTTSNPYRIDAEDGEGWYAFQEAKLNVKQVLTADDWNH